MPVLGRALIKDPNIAIDFPLFERIYFLLGALYLKFFFLSTLLLLLLLLNCKSSLASKPSKRPNYNCYRCIRVSAECPVYIIHEYFKFIRFDFHYLWQECERERDRNQENAIVRSAVDSENEIVLM